MFGSCLHLAARPHRALVSCRAQRRAAIFETWLSGPSNESSNLQYARFGVLLGLHMPTRTIERGSHGRGARILELDITKKKLAKDFDSPWQFQYVIDIGVFGW